MCIPSFIAAARVGSRDRRFVQLPASALVPGGNRHETRIAVLSLLTLVLALSPSLAVLSADAANMDVIEEARRRAWAPVPTSKIDFTYDNTLSVEQPAKVAVVRDAESLECFIRISFLPMQSSGTDRTRGVLIELAAAHVEFQTALPLFQACQRRVENASRSGENAEHLEAFLSDLSDVPGLRLPKGCDDEFRP